MTSYCSDVFPKHLIQECWMHSINTQAPLHSHHKRHFLTFRSWLIVNTLQSCISVPASSCPSALIIACPITHLVFHVFLSLFPTHHVSINIQFSCHQFVQVSRAQIEPNRKSQMAALSNVWLSQQAIFFFIYLALDVLGNSCIIRFARRKSIMGKGVCRATRFIRCIIFTGYLTDFHTLCHTVSYHLLDYRKTTDSDNDSMC